MEVDLRHRHAVGLGLCSGDAVIDGFGVTANLLRHWQAVQNGGNVRRSGVMMVVMFMLVVMFVAVPVIIAVVVMTVMGLIMGRLMNRPVDSIRTVPQGHVMTVLFLAVDGDVHVGAADTAGHRCLRGYSHPGDQVVHSVEEPLLVR